MFKSTMVVFLKEIKCIIRDKKTFIFGLLLPLILVPSMLFIIDFSMKNMQGQTSKNVNIAMSDKNNSFYNFCIAQDSITVVDVSNWQKALDSGEISAYAVIGDNIDEKIVKKEEFALEIKYNESSINSMMVMPIVGQYEEAFRYLVQNCEFKSVDQLRNTLNFKVDIEDSQNIQIDTSSLYFSMLVPMMLILYCCMGSSSTAAELSAGEKERGTLEPLLSTCANRTSIIVGKLLATTVMGVASGVFTVLGLWGYLLVSSGLGASRISPLGMIMLIFITIFIAMLFSAINLMIGVYAKSYKEAQTYLMPVSLICLVPTLFTYTLDAGRVGFSELCIPVFNILCIIKEILAQSLNPLHLAIVLFWLLIYISLAMSITVRLFKKENIIFRI